MVGRYAPVGGTASSYPTVGAFGWGWGVLLLCELVEERISSLLSHLPHDEGHRGGAIP